MANFRKKQLKQMVLSSAFYHLVPTATLRARLAIAFIYLSLIVTNFGLIYRSYGQVISNAQANNINLSRAVTERLDSTFSEADHIIEATVFELYNRGDFVLAAEALQPLMVNQVSRSRRLKDLFIFDSAGRWLTATTPNWDAKSNSKNRPYFIVHEHSSSLKTVVGPPLISQSSGEWVVPVSRRFNDENGMFAGVVLATLSVSDLRSLLEKFELGGGAITITVDNYLLIRQPYLEKDVGQKLPHQFATIFNSGRSGHGEAASPIDQVKRIYSYEQTTDYDVRVFVAAARTDVLKEWAIWSSLQTLWTLLLCVLLYRAVIYFRRSIVSRINAEKEVRAANEALSIANRELSRLARYDGLTGLANRRFFDQELNLAFVDSAINRQPVSVILIDVDDFKKYNDHYGHLAGDEALKRVSSCLAKVFSNPQSIVARYGGEEIVILLKRCGVVEAEKLAYEALNAVRALNITHTESDKGTLTISVGVACQLPAIGSGSSVLVDQADAALYMAKKSGKDRVSLSA